MNLKDKIVVITGATKGLGRSLAETALKEGAQVAALARNLEEIKELERELNVSGFIADVSIEASIHQVAQDIIEEFGRIDIWINNAGIWFQWADVEKTDLKKLRQMVEVNLFGTIYGSREAAMQMKKQKSGSIINIISTTALNGRGGSSGYAASKSGVIGFSKSIRKELGEFDIRVFSIYPGGMKTNIFGEEKIPGYGTFMEPQNVARAIWKNFQKENPEEELVLEYQKDLDQV